MFKIGAIFFLKAKISRSLYLNSLLPSSKNMIKHVFCDIGDVLMRCDGKKLCEDLAKVSNKPVDFFLERLVSNANFSMQNYPKWALKCDKGELVGECLYEEIACAANLKINYSDFKKLWCGMVRPNEHGLGWLEKIQMSYTTAIVSNIGDIHWEHLYDLVPVIKNCDEYVLSYQHGFVKPQEEIFALSFDFAREFRRDCFGDLSREECLFVDDRKANCEAARKFGFVALEYDLNNPKEFEEKVEKLGIK